MRNEAIEKEGTPRTTGSDIDNLAGLDWFPRVSGTLMNNIVRMLQRVRFMKGGEGFNLTERP